MPRLWGKLLIDLLSAGAAGSASNNSLLVDVVGVAPATLAELNIV